jgi:hypothetical protein
MLKNRNKMHLFKRGVEKRERKLDSTRKKGAWKEVFYLYVFVTTCKF